MNEPIEPTDQEIETILSADAFRRTYHKVLIELDALHRGVFDSADAEKIAALCLLSQAALVKQQSSAEHRARTFKRDIDFKKAEVYLDYRNSPPDGKKATETSLENLVTRNADVHNLFIEQGIAEKEAKEFGSIMAILKDAHITFRALIKKGA